MIGCIGIGPIGEPISCGTPGRHGGNLDHKVIGPGARVYLPVNVAGAGVTVSRWTPFDFNVTWHLQSTQPTQPAQP